MARARNPAGPTSSLQKLNGGVHSLMSHHYFASVVRTVDLDAINSQCREVVRRAAAKGAPQLPNAMLHCEPPHGLNLHDAHLHQASVMAGMVPVSSFPHG